MIALIVGTAPGADIEYWNASCLLKNNGRYPFTVAVNYSVKWLEKWDLWASLHPEVFKIKDTHTRTACPFDNGYGHPIVKELWLGTSSGLYGAQIALNEVKAEKVILCGIHLNNNPHYDRADFANNYAMYGENLFQIAPNHKKRIRSMGGATADFFGKPDAAWVLGS